MKLRGKKKVSSAAGLGISLAALAVFAAACGSSDDSGSSASSVAPSTSSAAPGSGSGSAGSGSGSAVSVTTHSGAMGTYLTDGSGRTVYLFASDTPSKSTCSGACAAQWPPLTTKNAPMAGSGVTGSKLTTITRDGGTKQVSFNGHPLYYFAGDSSAGDTNGQGIDAFGAKWYILSPAGSQIVNAGSSSPAAGGGNGY